MSPSRSGTGHDLRALGEREGDGVTGGLLGLLDLAGVRSEPGDAGDGELPALDRAGLGAVVPADVIHVDRVARGVHEESVLSVRAGPELEPGQVPGLPALDAFDVAGHHQHLAGHDRVLRAGDVAGGLVERRQGHPRGDGADVGIDHHRRVRGDGHQRVELGAETVDGCDDRRAVRVHLAAEVGDRGGVGVDGGGGGAADEGREEGEREKQQGAHG